MWLDRIPAGVTKTGGRRCFHCGRLGEGMRCSGADARTCFLDMEPGSEFRPNWDRELEFEYHLRSVNS